MPCPICPGLAPGRYARKNDPEFGELAGLCVDLDRSGMLLDDDVVAEGQTKAGPFAGWFGREEWIEHFFLHSGSDAAPVVANPDLEVSRRGCKGRLLAVCHLQLALHCRIKSVRNKVKHYSRNLVSRTLPRRLAVARYRRLPWS